MIDILNTLKKNKWTLIIVMGVLLVSSFGLFQNLFGINRSEEIALTILLITAIFWITEIIPLFVTSLGVLLFSITWLYPSLKLQGIEATKQEFLTAFFSDITLLFMGGFVLSMLLNKYGLAQRVADSIIKKTGDNPKKLLLSIILVSAVFSMWMSNTATAAMMLAIVSPLIYQLPKTSPFAKGMAISIPFACNLGGLGTPIGTPPNAVAMQYINQLGFSLSFLKWMVVAIPIMLILLYFLWQLLLKMYPPEDVEFKIENKKVNKLSTLQYAVILLFVITVLGWITAGVTGLSTGTIGLIAVFTSFATGLLKIPDFKNLSWDILFMLGGGLCLGVALNKSGLAQTIASHVGFGDNFMLLLLALLLLAAVMTTFMSNTATANLLIPIAVSLGQNEMIVSIAIAVMCSSAMALPVSTPPNAIAFGTGLLKAKDMIKPGVYITIVALLLMLASSYFFLPLILS